MSLAQNYGKTFYMPSYENFCDEARIDCLQTCPQLLASQSDIEGLERDQDMIITATMTDSPAEMVSVMSQSAYTIELPTDPSTMNLEEKEELSRQIRAGLSAVEESVLEAKTKIVARGKRTASACQLGPAVMKHETDDGVHEVSICLSPEREVDEHGNEIARHEVNQTTRLY